MTREEAINVLKTHYHKNPRTSYGVMVKQATEMAIQALQEQKVGKWHRVRYGLWTCSQCGAYKENLTTHYCSWCGAKMEGAEE